MDYKTASNQCTRPLQADIRQQVEDLYLRGHRECSQHRYPAALRSFYQAWVRLPKPQTGFDSAGKILTAIGDTYFKMKKYTQALEALRSSLHCPSIGSNNSLTYLRLGQCLLEVGQINQARIYLLKAHNSQGDTLLSAEDPKYRLAIDDLV
jgi:tetratricopeptide (TPR) repeat protein